ncbi:hypothetical protein PV341_16590 [Streptomyces sp. PA03-1a]|nr:hypothetical protein [Streptomyces sp. PA03-1a]MDX2818623.1 hypothetical protein [Streptomyces sp. PA03-5A]
MALSRISAELVAEDDCPGVEESLGRRDGWQVRDGANWIVSHDGPEITTRRLSDDLSRVFSRTRTWTAPVPDESSYATPTPDGLLVGGRHRITSLAADGSVRWAFDHDAWAADGLGRGACVAMPSDDVVLATIVGRVTNGTYDGDLCIALDSGSGELLGERTLPSFSALYKFQQSLVAANFVFLSAGQGQDDAHSLLVSLRDGDISAVPAGPADEPFTGNSLDGTSFLKLTRGGEILTRYEPAPSGLCRTAAHAEATTVLDDPEAVFVGGPGFVDRERVLAAVAEDIWPEESRHFLWDTATLAPLAEIVYPFSVSPEPIPLGDGTWITVSEDRVLRWRAGDPEALPA